MSIILSLFHLYDFYDVQFNQSQSEPAISAGAIYSLLDFYNFL